MNEAARQIRRNILEVSHASGHGHIPTCFSIVECLMAVYETIKHDPQKPDWEDRDLFVLSKGHASLGHYCTLAYYGYFDIQSVYSFGSFNTLFGCHADRLKVPGIEVSTGSLGHGIGVAVGMALAEKQKNSSKRVVTLIGDGESNEGSVWEALMIATDQGLDNFTVILDANQSQGRCLNIPNPAERLHAFGCDTKEVNGHDLSALCSLLNEDSDRPVAIVASTQKGYGSQTLVDNMYEWHRKSPDKEVLNKLAEELNAWQI